LRRSEAPQTAEPPQASGDAGLSAGERDIAIRVPALGQALPKAGLGVRPQEALGQADIGFAQPGFNEQRHLQCVCNDLRGRLSARQVARHDRIEPVRTQALGQCLRLRQTRGIERRIRVSLQPAFPVPVGLAVPEQEQDALVAMLFHDAMIDGCPLTEATK
jgi:hypothetical protein